MSLPISKPGESPYIKGVLFGPPKTGKTTLACSGTGKTLLILTEPEGDLSLRGRDNVDVIRPTGYADIADAIRYLQGKHDYTTVVLDSVTFTAELIGGDALAEALLAKKEPRQVYNRIGASVNKIIRDLIRLPMNVIFITQLKGLGSDEEEQNPEEGEYPVSLAITPMVYKILSPAVSFIGRTYKKRGIAGNPPQKVVEYWVSFEDYGRSPAGSRVDLPSPVKSPTLPALFAAETKE